MEPLSILPALRQEAQRLCGMGRDGGAALPGAAFGEAGTEGGHWARSLLPVSAQQFLHPHTDSIPPSPHQFQYPQTNSCIPSPTPASLFRPPHPNSSIPTPIPASPDRLLHPQTNSCLPTLTQFQLPTPIPASPPRLPPSLCRAELWVARGHSQRGSWPFPGWPCPSPLPRWLHPVPSCPSSPAGHLQAPSDAGRWSRCHLPWQLLRSPSTCSGRG